VLVEPGMGSKYDEKQRQIYELAAMDAVSQLARMGIVPGRIDTVVPTHLHLDHVGGATVRDDSGKAGPAFPDATVVAQRAEWDEALAVHPLTRGSYLPGDYLPLSEGGLLRLVDGDEEVAPDVRVQLTGGHTPGHQVIWIGSGEREALYMGDIVPTTAHLKLNWLMAWDLEPRVVYEARERLLADCVKHNTLVFWSHDPDVAACRLLEVKPGSFEIDPNSVIEARR